MLQADAASTTTTAAAQPRSKVPETWEVGDLWEVVLLFAAVSPVLILLWALAADAAAWRHAVVPVGFAVGPFLIAFAAPLLRLLAAGLLAVARALEGPPDERR